MSLFTPVFQTKQQHTPNQFRRSAKAASFAVFRDSLPISTWLAIGASVNSVLVLVVGRIALLIPAVFLIAKLFNALLIANGIKSNPAMANVISGKFSAQLPNMDGTFGPKAASQGVTVLLIGTRTNHAMGIMAPGFKELGGHMAAMQKDINKRSDEFGLINSSQWLGAERDSNNEIMYVMYFKTYE